MDDKKATDILIRLLDKYLFSNEEKEALATAIGVLSWTSLAKGSIKARKDKKVNSINKF
jgi:hypothetical protein